MSERPSPSATSRRVTHLTVKHTAPLPRGAGCSSPPRSSATTSYRYYALSQIPQAQVIRRLRDLDMPVAEVKAVLGARDVSARNALIAKHLERLELARTDPRRGRFAAIDSRAAELSGHASDRACHARARHSGRGRSCGRLGVVAGRGRRSFHATARSQTIGSIRRALRRGSYSSTTAAGRSCSYRSTARRR